MRENPSAEGSGSLQKNIERTVQTSGFRERGFRPSPWATKASLSDARCQALAGREFGSLTRLAKRVKHKPDESFENSFKRSGLNLVTETFTIGKMLSDFNSFLQSDSVKINVSKESEIHGHYRCSIVSCENIELGFGIHHKADISKELAYENVRQLFRANGQNLKIISAARVLNGGLLQCQLTISNQIGNISKVG